MISKLQNNVLRRFLQHRADFYRLCREIQSISRHSIIVICNKLSVKVDTTLKKTLFIKNTMILTATSLLLRFAGIIFKVWLASLIGSEGIGLHQLVFSVYVLVSTFASSGIVTAVTKLTAEELAIGSKKGAAKILRRSI